MYLSEPSVNKYLRKTLNFAEQKNVHNAKKQDGSRAKSEFHSLKLGWRQIALMCTCYLKLC